MLGMERLSIKHNRSARPFAAECGAAAAEVRQTKRKKAERAHNITECQPVHLDNYCFSYFPSI